MYKEIIIENQDYIKKLDLIQRDIRFDYDLLSINKIISFIWPRRAWKTFFMFQIIKSLVLSWKINLSQVVFFDFSEQAGLEFDFDKLLQNFYDLYPDSEPFFVFDEIQEINNFRTWVLKLFNKWFKIFLSWSNSKMLSSELSTHFWGRNIEYKILPLSFNEYLKFQNFTPYKNMTIKQKWFVNNMFLSYLNFGSYPEIALAKNENLKLSILQNYLEIIIYKDLKQRYNISNEYVLKYLIKKVILSNTKDLNISKIFNELKSMQIEVSKNTLYNYLEYLENIFFMKKLHNFFTPNWNIKTFLIDWWFSSLFKEYDLWKKLENMIFINLLSKYNLVYFERWKKEIDFFIETNNMHIQVVYQLNFENYKRELDVFKDIEGNKILIYFENYLSENILQKYTDIKFVNVIDYLL